MEHRIFNSDVGVDRFRILVGARFYSPGYKAGGPIRTLANLVDHLGQEFAFWIVTSDRDVGDHHAYTEIKPAAWNVAGTSQIYYVPPGFLMPFHLLGVIARTPHNLLYLNSLFDPVFTLLPLALGRLGLGRVTPVVLAPRGELSPGALGLKKRKKALFLYVAKLLRLYRGVIWQASSEYEAADIRAWMGKDALIIVAPNLPSEFVPAADLAAYVRKPEQPLRIVFLSRISPKKNLDLALRVLQSVKAPVVFSIYGPDEDQAYLDRCQRLGESLPGHVKVHWHGPVHPDQIAAVLAHQDLFFFPTRGENYGHVIAESLSVGTPVLLSDTTPWRDLEASGVGWDLPLNDEAAFAARIDQCARIPAADYAAWRERVRGYARSRLDVDPIVDANRRLFMTVAGWAAAPAVGKG